MPVGMLTESLSNQVGIKMDMEAPPDTDFDSVVQHPVVPDTGGEMSLTDIFEYILSPEVWPMTKEVLLNSDQGQEVMNAQSYNEDIPIWLEQIRSAATPHIESGMQVTGCQLMMSSQSLEIDVDFNT